MRRGVGSEGDDREEVDLHVHFLTERAVRVSLTGDDDKAEWLPLSEVDTVDGGPFRRGRVCSLLVPQWLLEKKGLC